MDWNLIIGIAGLVIGIAGLFGFQMGRTRTRRTVYYKDKADRKFQSIKDTLSAATLLDDEEFGGGPNKIIPQIQFERIDKYRVEESPELKGYKRTVRYLFKTENGQRWEKSWGFK